MAKSSGEEIMVKKGNIRLKGLLGMPRDPIGLVIFAHGSGSGRLSPRNNFVAKRLQSGGLATLLMDLLQPEEEEDRENVFDIRLLSERLQIAHDWVIEERPDLRHLPVGYFGASTGAGAALHAAAHRQEMVKAIVSRGGRPDLAEVWANKVVAPTLFIVGGHDTLVLQLNQSIYDIMTCTKDLVIVPGASHLFEEAGALEKVADLSTEWFQKHLTPDVPDIRQARPLNPERRESP